MTVRFEPSAKDTDLETPTEVKTQISFVEFCRQNLMVTEVCDAQLLLWTV